MQKSKFIYRVIIGDSPTNHLELSLDEERFNVLRLDLFFDLGLIVTVHKVCDDNVQDT